MKKRRQLINFFLLGNKYNKTKDIGLTLRRIIHVKIRKLNTLVIGSSLRGGVNSTVLVSNCYINFSSFSYIDKTKTPQKSTLKHLLHVLELRFC